MLLNLCGDVCMWAYQPSTEPEILISSLVEPASSPGEEEIHTHSTLMTRTHTGNHNCSCRGDELNKSDTWIMSFFKAAVYSAALFDTL